MIINHNMSALTANRILKDTDRALDRSLEKLATGQRINRAGDDAPGFAVSEKLRTQINGIAQAERNTMDGISFIQVTEGSLDQVNNILQRLRELSIQTANGIYSSQDRNLVQLEVDQLIEEVDRIGKTAEFNKINPLNGQFSKAKENPLTLHVGPNQNEQLKIYINTMDSSALKLQAGEKKESLSTPAGSNKMIGIVDEAINSINKQRADLGAYYNRLESTAKSLSNNYVNMVGAESRIRDLDMASEIVELTKNQLLTRTGSAMLAQANLKSESVIQLLSNRF